METLKNKKLLLACDVPIQKKVIEHVLHQFSNISIVNTEEKIKGLAKVFMSKPDLFVIAYENPQSSLDFITALRNNADFKNALIILILYSGINIFQRIKIGRLGIKDAFFLPLKQNDFGKIIKKYLEKDIENAKKNLANRYTKT